MNEGAKAQFRNSTQSTEIQKILSEDFAFILLPMLRAQKGTEMGRGMLVIILTSTWQFSKDAERINFFDAFT